MTIRRGPLFAAIVALMLALCPDSFASGPAQDGVREFRLKYLRPSDELLSTVRDLLGPGGRADIIKSLNLIVVKDDEAGISRVEGLLQRIDSMPAQVAIEARIVEVDTARSRELGVKWSALNTDVSGGVLGSFGAVKEGLSVSLPPSTDSGGAFTFGIITNKLSLDMKLSALESTEAAHVLSSPHVVVIENEPAVISSGTEIVLPATSGTVVISGQNGSDSSRGRTFSALIELAVTPRVVEGGRLALDISTRREEFDYTQQFEGFPPKTTKSANTSLIVRDGDTVVIGGIYTKSDSDSEDRVPLLGRIPLMGWLFKHNSKSDSQSELMIFLTPNVLKPDRGGIINSPPHE